MKKKILKKIYSAYNQLLLTDFYLLKIDSSERSITHKFAEYLQAEFLDWNVDCEYNRNGPCSKRLYGKRVVPDIIVHQRGTNNDNLLVIEAKKDNVTSEDIESDERKLMGYKRELNYRFAYMIIFPAQPNDFEDPLDYIYPIE